VRRRCRYGSPAPAADPARDPYFLYAASNLGSLLALLAYPLVIEAHLTLAEQTRWWTAGYGLLMVLVAACAVRLWRASPVHVTAEPPAVRAEASQQAADRVDLRRRVHWLRWRWSPRACCSA